MREIAKMLTGLIKYLQASDRKRRGQHRTADCRLTPADCRLPTADCRLFLQKPLHQLLRFRRHTAIARSFGGLCCLHLGNRSVCDCASALRLGHRLWPVGAGSIMCSAA
jgi:hypothetical protein